MNNRCFTHSAISHNITNYSDPFSSKSFIDMARIEIARLRKDHGMSQNELAQQLQITQSFLSAIENGKSPLPTEKEERIREIFSLPDLKQYTTETLSPAEAARHLAEMTDSDLFNQLLQRFHSQAHNRENESHHSNHHERISNLEEQNSSLLSRIDKMMERNDALASKNDELRNDIDTLRSEIYRLKSLLIENNITL